MSEMYKKSLLEHGFPFEHLSAIAEQESWRKEINRPTSYIHKWWARRLGSVFRGLIIGGIEEADTDLFDYFYKKMNYNSTVVFDPFMGSGTTVTEAVKLGARAIGSDINPVAAAIVRTALERCSREEVLYTYHEIEKKCGERIKTYYRAIFNSESVDVLYYFWVKTILCDDCKKEISLYKTTIFSKNAYPSKKPQAQSVCPCCGHINQVSYNDESTECMSCHRNYNPQAGNVDGNEYVCPGCGKRERIVDYTRRTGAPLSEKMYAKMIIDNTGNKHYLGIDQYDLALFADTQKHLSEYTHFIPSDSIHEGINTNQILNYQYRQWREMFNSRQLLAFGILSQAISEIEDFTMRRLFAVLMSGTLEFNNMFCSFKGEGTGAVRPLFYNHILKNELMPLEANVWGCKASSGSFSTLFESRVIRMLDYKEQPFELKLQETGKADKVVVEGCNIETTTTESINEWDENTPLIMCQDSAHTELPDKCVDLIVTDPPFFDNVNYSELADFFYVWLKKLNIGVGDGKSDSTRMAEEVQDNDPCRFSSKLCDVLKESNRVLKDDGKLIFTYHHSKAEGWVSVFNAICGAGFIISEVIPIKAEMAVSVAISAAKVPINYDLVFICRKKDKFTQAIILSDTTTEYDSFLHRFTNSGLKFSTGDQSVLLYGLVLKQLSQSGKTSIEIRDIEKAVESLGLK